MIKKGIMKLSALRDRMQVPLQSPPVIETDDELQPQAESLMALLGFVRWVATDCGSILAVGMLLLPGGIIWAAFQPDTTSTAIGGVVAGIGGIVGITGYAMVRLGLLMAPSLQGEGRNIAWILRRMTVAGIPGAILVFASVIWMAWGLAVDRQRWSDGLLIVLFVGPAVAGPLAAMFILVRYRDCIRAICDTPADKFDPEPESESESESRSDPDPDTPPPE